MILRFLFTRSEFRGTLLLTIGVVTFRVLLFAIGPTDTIVPILADSTGLNQAYQAKKKSEKIEINSADSVEMISLTGIGPVFARRIIKYRTALGGFAKKDQLMEVYGMDSIRYKGFINQIKLDTGHLVKLDVNRATFKELLAHPYLDYEQVKAVCRFREKKGILTAPGELWAAGVLPDSLRSHLVFYLFAGKDSVQKELRGFVK